MSNRVQLALQWYLPIHNIYHGDRAMANYLHPLNSSVRVKIVQYLKMLKDQCLLLDALLGRSCIMMLCGCTRLVNLLANKVYSILILVLLSTPCFQMSAPLTATSEGVPKESLLIYGLKGVSTSVFLLVSATYCQIDNSF